MKSVTVEIDTREKLPLLFPERVIWCPRPFHREIVRITTVRKELAAGDYRIASDPGCCVVERKGSLDELHQNLLTADRARFGNAWTRFLECCRFPVLLVEDSPHRAWTPRGEKALASDVLSSFWRLVTGTSRLTVLWTGKSKSPATRRRLGGQIVMLMLACLSQPMAAASEPAA